MIKLVIYPSNTTYEYDTKTKALRDIKANGLKSPQYTLTDEKNRTQYKGGIWLTSQEMQLLENGLTINAIKTLRKY